MEYLLMIYGDEARAAEMTPGQAAEMTAAFGAYTEALKEAGVWRAGARLRPVNTATVVRAKNGKTEVLNGPYAETREQLGGYYLIDAPDLDEALAWAARCPAADYAGLEVRPIWPAAEYDVRAR